MFLRPKVTLPATSAPTMPVQLIMLQASRRCPAVFARRLPMTRPTARDLGGRCGCCAVDARHFMRPTRPVPPWSGEARQPRGQCSCSLPMVVAIQGAQETIAESWHVQQKLHISNGRPTGQLVVRLRQPFTPDAGRVPQRASREQCRTEPLLCTSVEERLTSFLCGCTLKVRCMVFKVLVWQDQPSRVGLQYCCEVRRSLPPKAAVKVGSLGLIQNLWLRLVDDANKVQPPLLELCPLS